MTRKWIWILGVVAFALLGIAAFSATSGIEDTLEQDGLAALEAAGVTVGGLEADGRTLRVIPADGDGGQRAAEILEAVDGVRSIDIDLPDLDTDELADGSTPTSSATTAPLATDAPATTVPTTVPSADVAAAIDDLLADEPLEFDADTDEPTEASKATLDEIGELLLDNDLRVSVTGWFDGDDDEDDNLEVSDARAWSSAGYLEYLGVDFDRMDVEGLGSGSGNGDDAGERVVIMVLEGDGS
ncbi:MAG: outer membrane protein OmpA-like peptidoglycan-associated protein [Candidatus Poriferisodalaceae bacterium]|jgi:outer membrane protein OmpA-like peptidoglycan-associated protein